MNAKLKVIRLFMHKIKAFIAHQTILVNMNLFHIVDFSMSRLQGKRR